MPHRTRFFEDKSTETRSWSVSNQSRLWADYCAKSITDISTVHDPWYSSWFMLILGCITHLQNLMHISECLARYLPWVLLQRPVAEVFQTAASLKQKSVRSHLVKFRSCWILRRTQSSPGNKNATSYRENADWKGSWQVMCMVQHVNNDTYMCLCREVDVYVYRFTMIFLEFSRCVTYIVRINSSDRPHICKTAFQHHKIATHMSRIWTKPQTGYATVGPWNGKLEQKPDSRRLVLQVNGDSPNGLSYSAPEQLVFGLMMCFYCFNKLILRGLAIFKKIVELNMYGFPYMYTVYIYIYVWFSVERPMKTPWESTASTGPNGSFRLSSP